jgi:hypothetical protein
VVTESKISHRSGYDVLGAVISTVGLVALVFGFSQAQASGWGSPVTLACVVAGAVLVVVVILVESRVASPLLPLRVVFEKVRGGSLSEEAITRLAAQPTPMHESLTSAMEVWIAAGMVNCEPGQRPALLPGVLRQKWPVVLLCGGPLGGMRQAARRWTSQMVAAMSSADSASSQPPSIHWKGQNRLAGW